LLRRLAPRAGERNSRLHVPLRNWGNDGAVPGRLLYRAGLRGWHLHLLSLVFVVYCLGLWIRAKTVDQAQRGVTSLGLV
jgi:hypothetical protein